MQVSWGLPCFWFLHAGFGMQEKPNALVLVGNVFSLPHLDGEQLMKKGHGELNSSLLTLEAQQAKFAPPFSLKQLNNSNFMLHVSKSENTTNTHIIINKMVIIKQFCLYYFKGMHFFFPLLSLMMCEDIPFFQLRTTCSSFRNKFSLPQIGQKGCSTRKDVPTNKS